MNYASMAQRIRHERVELLRAYAHAGYRPAWGKLVYMAVGLDLPFDQIVEMEETGELVDQALNNPFVERP